MHLLKYRLNFVYFTLSILVFLITIMSSYLLMLSYTGISGNFVHPLKEEDCKDHPIKSSLSNSGCFDTDGGKNTCLMGRVDFNSSYNDECLDSKYLKEYYCPLGDSEKKPGAFIVSCVGKCINGACVK